MVGFMAERIFVHYRYGAATSRVIFLNRFLLAFVPDLVRSQTINMRHMHWVNLTRVEKCASLRVGCQH